MASRGFYLTQIKEARVGFSTDALLGIARKMFKDLRPGLLKNHFIEIVWVTDKAIKKLNKQYRGKDERTDILSFHYGDSGNTPFGQLIISVDTLRRQAKSQNHAYYQEAQILFVHGILHLLGYDHMKKKDFEKMKKREQRYLGDKSGLVARSTLE